MIRIVWFTSASLEHTKFSQRGWFSYTWVKYLVNIFCCFSINFFNVYTNFRGGDNIQYSETAFFLNVHAFWRAILMKLSCCILRDNSIVIPRADSFTRPDSSARNTGTTSAVTDCSTNHDSADRITGQFLFYHDHNLQKVRETCVFDVLYRCSSSSAFA